MSPAPLPVEVQAAILGVVQGVCEFLPVSSSAHLVVIPEILGWPYLGKGFDVALHVGTLAALVGHFRGDLARLWRAAQRLLHSGGRAGDSEAQLVKMLVIGSVPAALAGFLLDDVVERYLHGLLLIAVFSIFWGAALGWADNGRFEQNKTIGELTPGLALLIGSAQALALLPGTSRSGATITAALLLGLSRPEATRFSLLLSVPVVAGAALFKGWDCYGSANPQMGVACAIGVLASAVAGRLCLRTFLAYLHRGDVRPFSIYRISFGLVLLGWLLVTAY